MSSLSSPSGQAMMPSSVPPIPHRRSSLEPSRPTPPKKRMSLTSKPILSMLGLARTSSSPSSPIMPSSAHSSSTSPTSQTHTPIKSSHRVVGKEVEEDQESGEDGAGQGFMEEPESLERDTDLPTRSTLLEPKAKGKLTLDIPPSCSTGSSPPSSFRHHSDSAIIPLLERPTDQEDVFKDLGGNHTKRCHGRTPQSPQSSTKGVWLCSKPQPSSPSSPIDENGIRRRSIGRPLVVRSMSTGRLAREFDEEGRVVSLSTHCERVLKGRPVASSPTRIKDGDDLRRTVSVANALTPTRAGFTRAQTSSNVVLPVPIRRKSVEAGFRRLENVGSWNKRVIGAGDVRM